MCFSETPVDRPISFPLSSIHSNGEKNGPPLLPDFHEDIQFMDIEDNSGMDLNLWPTGPFTFTATYGYVDLFGDSGLSSGWRRVYHWV